MQLKKRHIEVGVNVKSFDEDDNRWFKAEIVEVTDDYVKFKDVDPGEWQGLLWEAPWNEIGDTDLYRKLP